MATEKNLNIDFKAICKAPEKSTKVMISPLMAARKDLITSVEGNTRSVSSYFKEYRKDHTKVENWLKEAVKKGRKFDSEKIHRIVNLGELALITDADKVIQAAKEKPAKNWSANRLHVAFIAAVTVK